MRFSLLGSSGSITVPTDATLTEIRLQCDIVGDRVSISLSEVDETGLSDGMTTSNAVLLMTNTPCDYSIELKVPLKGGKLYYRSLGGSESLIGLEYGL